jgi:hypothetical protein
MRRLTAKGVLVHVPLILGLFLVAVIRSARPGHLELAIPLAVWMALCGIDGLISLMVFVLLARDAHGNPRLDRATRIFWYGLLFVGNFIVYPIYWWRYMWSKPSQTPASAS